MIGGPSFAFGKLKWIRVLEVFTSRGPSMAITMCDKVRSLPSVPPLLVLLSG